MKMYSLYYLCFLNENETKSNVYVKKRKKVINVFFTQTRKIIQMLIIVYKSLVLSRKIHILDMLNKA